MFRILALSIWLFASTILIAQPKAEKPLAEDLALVPADSDVVFHVKLADLWKSDALKDARMIYAKAGTDAVAAFDKRFVPLLSSVDHLTVYVHRISINSSPADLKFVGLLTLTEPLDQKRFLSQFSDKVISKKGKLAEYFTDEDGAVGIRFISPKLVAFGMSEAIKDMCDTKPAATGPMLTVLNRANSSKEPFVFGLSFESLPAEAKAQFEKEVPPPIRPLLRATSMSLSMDMEGDGHVHAVMTYPDAKGAEDAEMAVVAATGMAMEMIRDTRKPLLAKVLGDGKPAKIEDLPEAAASLLGLGALQHAEDILRSKPVKRNGTMLTLSQPLPPQLKTVFGAGALASSMVLPATQKIREAAARMKSSNNMKQIALALHNYESANGHFPPAAIVDKKGKALLSWRVAILPYIEQDNLYRQFKLDEPWDSEHNLKIAQTNVPTFMIPNQNYPKPGYTHYRAFVGEQATFDRIKGRNIADVTDGLSNTWMVVEAGESVPWAKPDDLEFDPKKELPKLGNFFRGGFHVAMGDGSVRFFAKVPKMAKEMITRSGGEVIQDDE